MRVNNDSREPVEFCGEVRFETEKAYLVYDGSEEMWIPKSLIQESKRLSDGGWEFVIPYWLAKDKGII